MRFPGKQVEPITPMGNLPAIAAPQSLEQYLVRINEGLATAEYLVGPTAPFTTIQSAIDAAVADGASPLNPKVVLVMPAPPYVENLTLTGGGVTLVALAPNLQTGSCYIIGDVSVVDPGAGPGEFPAYFLQGFYIEGQITITGTPSSTPCVLWLDSTTVAYFSPGDTLTNAVNNFSLRLTGASAIVSGALPTDRSIFSPVGAQLSITCAYSSTNRISVGFGIVDASYSNLGAVICGASGFAFLHACYVTSGSEAAVQLNATAGQLTNLSKNTFQRSGTAGPVVTTVGVTAPYRHVGNTAVGNITDPAFPSLGSIDGFDWEGYASTTRNRNMAASVTAADGDLACATPLSVRPAQGSMVRVTVNGIEVLVAANNAERATSECYFSADGGATAKSFGQVGTIAAGDLLYWNGTVATYELAATDLIRFDYAVSPYQIN